MSISHDSVETLFSNLANGHSERFLEHVADDIDWTLLGTHPLAGRYRSKAEFVSRTFARLGRIFTDKLRLVPQHIHIDGETAIVEMKGFATDLRGKSFDQTYCWVCRFSGTTIVEVRAYLDSEMMTEFIAANEALL